MKRNTATSKNIKKQLYNEDNRSYDYKQKTGLQHKICNPAKYSIILITIQFSLQGLHLPVR